MKVLLLADVDPLGWFGDVVEVPAGYARNYLLPQALATAATEVNLRAVADESQRRAEQRATHRKRLEAAAEALDGAAIPSRPRPTSRDTFSDRCPGRTSPMN